MKKIISALVMVVLSSLFISSMPCLTFAATFASPESQGKSLYIIEGKYLHSTNTTITGNIPYFSNISDKAFSDKVNGIISKFYEDTIKKAEDAKKQGVNPTVNFNYSATDGSSKYFCIIMHSSINYGNTSTDDIKTIVLDSNIYKLYSLTDILGPNAYKIVDKVISRVIKASPELYLKPPEGFKGSNSATNFYIDGRDLVVIFNKYEISPGYVGNPKFTLDLNTYLSIGLPKGSYYVKNKITMVPLVNISKIFKQTVKLNSKTNVTLTYEDKNYTLACGINNYNGKRLEYAPQLKNDVIYVPISYFETICGISYNIMKDGTINFSKLMF